MLTQLKILTTLLMLLVSLPIVCAQTIYSREYGDKSKPAIIFVHGGPSSSAALFEATTAQSLAERGFYVIAYDRRGEGRSTDSAATFKFQEASDDLISIYNKYNISHASILAHSFGGIVAAYFSELHPEKVQTIILVAALFSQQETYNHILETMRRAYHNNCNQSLLDEIMATEKLATNTSDYRKACYNLVKDCFEMPSPTKESLELWNKYKSFDYSKQVVRNMDAPEVFFRNEALNNVDIQSVLYRLKSKGIKLIAIYGKQDCLFSKKQLKDMRKIVGRKNFSLIDNCSHYVFVDQQQAFLKAIVEI